MFANRGSAVIRIARLVIFMSPPSSLEESERDRVVEIRTDDWTSVTFTTSAAFLAFLAVRHFGGVWVGVFKIMGQITSTLMRRFEMK